MSALGVISGVGARVSAGLGNRVPMLQPYNSGGGYAVEGGSRRGKAGGKGGGGAVGK